MEKTLQELEEFYTDDTGAFTVGKIVMESSADIALEGVDEQGKSCGYFVMPARKILERRKGTPYLRKIAEYMDYASHNPYASWYTPPAFPAGKEEPLLSQILRHVLGTGELITIGIADEEMPFSGFVKSFAKGTAVLRLVDQETAQILDEERFRIRDIEYIEYGSIDNRLLQFACEKVGINEK